MNPHPPQLSQLKRYHSYISQEGINNCQHCLHVSLVSEGPKEKHPIKETQKYASYIDDPFEKRKGRRSFEDRSGAVYKYVAFGVLRAD